MPDDRRILIISPTFYPEPLVSGVRVTQWCRHLPEFGWTPMVLCRRYDRTATSDGLAEHVHPKVRLQYYAVPADVSIADDSQQADATVIHGGSRRSSRLWTWIRRQDRLRNLASNTIGRLMVPDTGIRFWRQVRQETLAVVDEFKPDVILTSSPPHSIHDLGVWLVGQRPHIPWIADYRDPHLIDIRFSPTGWRRSLWPIHERFRSTVYEHASLVTHAIPVAARWARRQLPAARRKIKILMNGCPIEICDRPIAPIDSTKSRRRICVMGASKLKHREQLVRATQRLIERGNDVELCLLGPSYPDDDAHRELLGDCFSATGYLPHPEALARLREADALVCAVPPKTQLCYGLSSKLFEYLAFGRPIVMINPTRPDQQFLKPYRGTRILSHPNEDELADALEWSLSAAAYPPIGQTEQFRQTYSRRSQVQQLVAWMNEIVDSAERQA